jgi:formate hydrogenlyase transcriptional activator
MIIIAGQATADQRDHLRGWQMSLATRDVRSLGEVVSDKRQLQALVEVLDCINCHTDLQELFDDLAARLRRLVFFDAFYVSLHNPVRDVMRISIVETTSPVTLPVGLEIAKDDSASWMVWHTQQILLLDDLDQETRFPVATRIYRESGIRRVCLFPLTTAGRKLGAVAFARKQDLRYEESELRLLENATAEMVLALDNHLRSQEVVSYEKQLQQERDRGLLLLDITNALVRNRELDELFTAISTSLRRIMRHEYAALILLEEDSNFRLCALDFPGGSGLLHPDLRFAKEGSLAGRAFKSGNPVLISHLQAKEYPGEVARMLVAEGLKSACCLPLVNRQRTLGVLTVASCMEGAFSVEDTDLLSQIANQVAIAVDNALAFREIAELKEKLAGEKSYLEDEIRTTFHFDEIIGESTGLKTALEQVQTVAPTDAAVLILGETGTGKELIARAIQRHSRRSAHPLIKINCSAIPTGLLESELFGHEKGAFTGAIAQKIGRLELADKGTIFLDEVGDIPLELQPKLLRALQESEFERLGSSRTIKVDVRLVAATNRDLAQMVADNQFRSDLYYRLRVFPILVPPLRERKADVPPLVNYFTRKYAVQMGKKIKRIPQPAMDALCNWHWPGNIRELENFIERAVILSSGPELNVPVEELKEPVKASPEEEGTLESTERDYILRILRETGGVISGPQGAAARLGLKRTTLQGKMRKLGIARRDVLGNTKGPRS